MTKVRAIGSALDNLSIDDGPSRGFAEMLPEQFWGSPQVNWSGEHWLMFRVLEDAIHCYLRGRGMCGAKHLRLAREAKTWLTAEDYAWPFSFVSICATLNIDAGYLLRGILRTPLPKNTHTHTDEGSDG